MENFIQQIKLLSNRIEKIKGNIQTEEATKTSLIMPFIQSLGYDIFNPEEFVPEFIADVGIKKGEKIDYAIIESGNPIILIEAKSVHEKLNKHDSQLYRYFGTTKAKFAILTNGIEYKFYTDLEEPNKMDVKPFLVFNMLELRDNLIFEIAKFRKTVFDVDNVLTTASELKYTGEIKQFLNEQWEEPNEEFIKFIINEVYQGVKTKKVIDNFRDIVKKSLIQFLNERVSDKLQKALNSSENNENTLASDEVVITNNQETQEKSNEQVIDEIVTTEEEIEGYVLVKLLLKDVIETKRFYYRDNKSYFNILIDDSIRKWICRLGLNTSNKYVQFNDDDKTTFKINDVNELILYKDKLIEVASKFSKN
ncbi:MAG TPA: type I restriction endonuclease [Rummeliibacillus sp.]|nr:type I restriction endonuclease [Rummeliibacillus sp.]